jgi:tryptophanyl-tRNA synthetase
VLGLREAGERASFPLVKTSLTGIQATGTPHLGNYIGAIRPALKLAETYRSFYFIADYHALTTINDPRELRSNVYDVAATWLACGLDPEQTVFYRQSAIPEVHELAWIFACLISTGQLERGHSYKDALAKGEAPNAGLFNYPLLMAADIILYDAHVVPVGRDQKQHMEVARDLSVRFNHVFGDTLVVPEAEIRSEILVPGLDGRKMSKSYGNYVPLFAPAKELKNQLLKIVTGSEALEAPKAAEGTTIFTMYQFVASAAQCQEMADKLRAGGYGWGHAKQALFEAIDAAIGPYREKYVALRKDEPELDRILLRGAERAREIAHVTIARVRKAIGTA